jgi:hypothetical protein
METQARRPGDLRLMFIVFVHADLSQVVRLLNQTYNQKHMYLIIVDKGQTAFYQELKIALKLFPGNVVVGNPIDIVYKSPVISRLLVHILAWALKFLPKWDYVISLTGSDYPIVPLYKIEQILSSFNPPFPRLMLWGIGIKAEEHTQGLSLRARNSISKLLNTERRGVSQIRGNHQWGDAHTCIPGIRLMSRFGIRLNDKNKDQHHTQVIIRHYL